MRLIMPRFSSVDWFVSIVLVTLFAFEASLFLGLVQFGFDVGLALFQLMTLAVLAGVVWLVTPTGRRLRLGKGESAVIGVLLAGGLIGAPVMLYSDAMSNAFWVIVGLGFFIVAAAAYVVTRADGVIEPVAEQAVSLVSELSSDDLQRIDIFRDLSPEELAPIAEFSRHERIPQGTVLVTAPEATGDLYAILDGRAEMHAVTAIGEITVRVAGPGESFPLAALVGSGQVITSARAMSEMDVAVIPVAQLRAHCDAHPETATRMYAAMAGILADRYRATLARLTTAMQEALKGADFWANV